MKFSIPLLVVALLVSAHCGQALLRKDMSANRLESQWSTRYDPKSHFCRRLIDTLDKLDSIPSHSDRLPEDPIFPANSLSLANPYHKVDKDNEDIRPGKRTVVWETMHGLADELHGLNSFSIFGHGTTQSDIFFSPYVDAQDPDDIEQGYLGDCYFLSALSAIVKKDKTLIKGAFKDPSDHELTHQVKFLANGQRVTVKVDDMIPLDDSRDLTFQNIAGAKNFWPIIMEKAWAKLHSSYNAIDHKGGEAAQVIHSLTQVPIEVTKVKDKKLYKTPKDLYDKIENSMNSGFFVSTGEKDHEYSIMDFAHKTGTLSTGAPYDTRAVKIRDPLGKDEKDKYKGDTFTKNKKLQKKFPNTVDGVFWIEIGDYQKMFNDLGVGFHYPNYETKFNHDAYDKDNNGKWMVYTFKLENTLKAEGAWLMISGVEQRLIPSGCRNGVVKIHGSAYEVNANKANSREILEERPGKLNYRHVNLKTAGEYVAVVRVKYPNEHYSEVNAGLYYPTGMTVNLSGRKKKMEDYKDMIVNHLIGDVFKNGSKVPSNLNGPKIVINSKDIAVKDFVGAAQYHWIEFSADEDSPVDKCLMIYGVKKTGYTKQFNFKIEFPATTKLVSTTPDKCKVEGGTKTNCEATIKTGEYWGVCALEEYTAGSFTYSFTKKTEV